MAGVRVTAPRTALTIMGAALNPLLEEIPAPIKARVAPELITRARELTNTRRVPKGDGAPLVAGGPPPAYKVAFPAVRRAPAARRVVLPFTGPRLPPLAPCVPQEKAPLLALTPREERQVIQALIRALEVAAKGAPRGPPQKALVGPRKQRVLAAPRVTLWKPPPL